MTATTTTDNSESAVRAHAHVEEITRRVAKLLVWAAGQERAAKDTGDWGYVGNLAHVLGVLRDETIGASE